MTNLPKAAFAAASLALAITLSGCCVTSISSKRVCQEPAAACQPNYEQTIPQGINPSETWPMETPPPIEPAPQPYVPPAPVPPSAAKAKLGTKTTSMMRQFGDGLRDTFTRS